MSGYIYLASPYSHPNPAVREMRYVEVCKAAAKLMKAGRIVFSPIAHSHPIEVIGIGETESGEFWKKQDIPLLRHASELYVLCLDGWKDSAGLKWEMEIAESLHIPTLLFTQDQLLMRNF